MAKRTMGKTRYAGIYRRPNGHYLARVRNRFGNLSKAFTDLDAAYRWRRDTLSDLENGRAEVVDGETLTTEEAQRRRKSADGRALKDLIDRYQKTGECRIRAAYLNHWRDELGDKLVEEITRADALAGLDKIKGSPATHNRYRSGIHRLMTYANEVDWISGNVVTGIKAKREDNRRDHVIDPDEEAALMKACEAHDPKGRLSTIFALAMATGARAGELQGLTWGALNLKAGTARLGWGTTKNRQPRTLIIRGHALDRLKEYAKIQPINKGELVFHSDSGETIYEISREFRKAADSIGKTNVVLHHARHTFATRLARVPGMTLVMLRDALGHRTLQMVSRYAHEMTDDLGAALDRMLSQ
jgi:integrase